MADKVTLVVGERELSVWSSYKVTHDLYLGAGHFTLECGRIDWKIPDAALCKLYVNDQLELTGIVDRISASYDKKGEKLTIEGRDLMGLVVDSSCEEFFSVAGMKLSELARRLLGKLFTFNRALVIGDDIVGGLKRKQKQGSKDCLFLGDKPQVITQLHVGMTVFQVLRDYAMSRGLMFYCLPDGTFTFGKPKSLGGEVVRTLIHRLDGVGNNIISGEYERDSAKRYSSVRVMGMQQGQDEMGMEPTKMINSTTLPDPTFPFHKALVVKNNNDYQSTELHAQMLLERMRHEGLKLNYKVARHSQGGENWGINRLCRVRDQALNVGLDGTYLIYGRTFSMSKSEGQITELRLGPPGVVA